MCSLKVFCRILSDIFAIFKLLDFNICLIFECGILVFVIEIKKNHHITKEKCDICPFVMIITR